MKLTKLDSGWTFEFLEAGNLPAAVAAVEGRTERGLGTPEGIEITKSTAIPTALKGKKYEAVVPGNIHDDLLRLGIIDDPHLGLNEFRTQWIGRSRWKYACNFQVTEIQEFNNLVFHGIDTVAAVYLNGELLLRANDMHIRYEIDVSGKIQIGANSLELIFESQEDWAEERARRNGSLPNAYSDPTNQIRKMACNYGWDWGPTLVTVGLWQPVELHQYSSKFGELRVLPSAEGQQATLAIGLEVVGKSEELQLEILVSGTLLVKTHIEEKYSAIFAVENVELWWPRGYGEQPLYEIQLKLTDASGSLVDSRTMQVGFRKVEIISEPDDIGRNFEIRVNNQRIWVRGANWIPAHTSLKSVTKELYETRIYDAIQANMNLLRVWGGGIFETNAFYEICDREGLLVWQDCLFACAAYPEADEDLKLIEIEITQASERLSHHASLAVWNGSNENIWGYFDWGWQEDLKGRPWGLGIYLELLPSLLKKLDPTRPYQPSSPYSQTMEVHPNDPNHGTAHLWEPWNRQDYTHYLDSVPRFATEYGYGAPASISTMKEAIGADELSENSPGMRSHLKARDGLEKLRRSVDLRFVEPRNFNEWHFLTQLEQARALATAITHLRSHYLVCSGSVIWQLNDCWPVSSWALVDSGGQRKPAWHAVRKSYQDLLISFQGDEKDLRLSISNDSQKSQSVAGNIELWDFAGNKQVIKSVNITVGPNSSVDVQLSELGHAVSPSNNYLAFEFGGEAATKFFKFDKELNYQKPHYELVATKNDIGLSITLKADSLMRDVCISPDQFDPHSSSSDSFFTLVPGATKTLEIRTQSPEKFTIEILRNIIRTANDQAK